MAKSRQGSQRTKPAATTSASRAQVSDTVTQRVNAFAELLGRIAGTVQTKAQGWADADTLRRQIAMVRDGAADLLEQMAGGTTDVSSTPKPTGTPARKVSGGRSGGVVDAPGKKHRKPPPRDPDAKRAERQAAKMREARPMAKTNRLRGRG